MKTVVLLTTFVFIICCLSCRSMMDSTLKEPLLDMEFKRIRKGSFQMGDSNNKNAHDYLHKVTITKDFWLGITEVTQDQWQQIMGIEELHPQKPSPYRNTNPNYPVVSVSFHDVELFLKKLNKRSELYQFRLPTEAEWEYACRAGTETPFSYGVCLFDSLANYNAQIASIFSVKGDYTGHPVPVGSYAPNQWGLYDMHGNVWEWVNDWYAPYTANESTDPKGPPVGKEKVIRGGSWYFGAKNARSSNRRTHEPHLWGYSIGFRIVCEK